MSLIALSNVNFSYEGQNVLEGINFSVTSGDYLLIVGENGAGKSTLLKGLLGLKKQSSGELSFMEGLKPNEIGYLPQQSEAQRDFPASVYEVVVSGCLNSLNLSPFYKREHKKIALEAMDYLGISALKNKCYRNLSGGQQQRVLLARALCASKKLLILDEPVTGLDPLAQRELYDMIDRLNKERGITIIMVSHDITESINHAKHILHLDRKQLFFGTKEEYMETKFYKGFVKEAI